jgi:hypothetical protein
MSAGRQAGRQRHWPKTSSKTDRRFSSTSSQVYRYPRSDDCRSPTGGQWGQGSLAIYIKGRAWEQAEQGPLGTALAL